MGLSRTGRCHKYTFSGWEDIFFSGSGEITDLPFRDQVDVPDLVGLERDGNFQYAVPRGQDIALDIRQGSGAQKLHFILPEK